ncbi:MAG: guanylate kinase [Verrucomicrobiales bacterium]
MTDPAPTGLLCIVSGPSGSGKTTLCRAACQAENAHYSISATTRLMRPGEVNGRDYHFLSEEDFIRSVEAGDFLEHATVFGRRYGTLKSEVLPRLARGQDVIMDLDVQGAAQMRAHPDPDVRRAFLDVFLVPPSLDELRARLLGRHTDAPDVQAGRLAAALEEIAHWRAYEYTILSDTKETDLARFRGLLAAERLRSRRRARLPGYDSVE